jgi:hypothetical protein
MLRFQSVMALLALALIAGCSNEPESTSGTGGAGVGPSDAGQAYILSSEPDGAVDVIAAREDAENDADIVVVGRIGGQVDPWVEGLAAFTIVDESLADCSQIEGDSCPTPWDYCCASGVAEARTLVKFVDESGEVVETDAKELLGLTELQTVVVQGKAQVDADGNLTILASKVFVRPHVDRPMVEAGSHTHSHDDGGHTHSHDDSATEEGEHEHSHDEGEAEHSHEDSEHEHSHDDATAEESDASADE